MEGGGPKDYDVSFDVVKEMMLEVVCWLGRVVVQKYWQLNMRLMVVVLRGGNIIRCLVVGRIYVALGRVLEVGEVG